MKSHLPIIQSLWIGDPLSQLEKLCIQSFLCNGHEFHLYIYDDVGEAPPGTTLKDANAILPKRDILEYGRGGVAGFSNRFRYALLYQRGGFWVDMDMICIKALDLTDDIVFGYSSANTIGGAVLKFPCGHPFMRYMLDLCENPNKRTPWNTGKDKLRKRLQKLLQRGKQGAKFGDVGGPRILTPALIHHGMQTQAKPYPYFYWLTWHHWNALFDDTFKNGCMFQKHTYAIHTFNERRCRQPGFDKNATFDEGSLIEQLKRKYQVAPLPDAPRMTTRQINQFRKQRNFFVGRNFFFG